MGLLRRSFFPFNALGMPSFNNSEFLNHRAAKLTWTGAKSSCERKGMKMISMNDPSTREFFLQMLERYIIF